jgi:two-component system, OmpR family, response regulator MprA
MGRCQHGYPTPRILVIEDESLITTLVVLTLTDEGYEVRSAGDGLAALDLVQAWTPCLILLDILMPVMDGRAFLRKLWQLEDLSTTPVVLMSGAGGPLLSDVTIRVADVIHKPFSLELLLGMVARLVA